jgi:hypothetical protein
MSDLAGELCTFFVCQNEYLESFIWHTKSITKRLILVSVVFAKKDALNTTWRIALKDYYQLHTMQH